MSAVGNQNLIGLRSLYSALQEEIVHQNWETEIQSFENEPIPGQEIQVQFPQILNNENAQYVHFEMPLIITRMIKALQVLDFSHYAQDLSRRVLTQEQFEPIVREIGRLDTRLTEHQLNRERDSGFERSFKLRLEPFLGALANRVKTGLHQSESIKFQGQLQSRNLNVGETTRKADISKGLMSYCLLEPRKYAVQHLKALLNIDNNFTVNRKATTEERKAIKFLEKIVK